MLHCFPSLGKEIKLLKGPINCKVFKSDKYRKTFILFGDFHSTQSNCPETPNVVSLGNFMKNILSYANSYGTNADIFLELGYGDYVKSIDPIHYIDPATYFGEVDAVFSKCFSYNKTNCYYYNKNLLNCGLRARFHYGDVRHILGHRDTNYPTFLYVLNMMKNPLTQDNFNDMLNKFLF